MSYCLQREQMIEHCVLLFTERTNDGGTGDVPIVKQSHTARKSSHSWLYGGLQR